MLSYTTHTRTHLLLAGDDTGLISVYRGGGINSIACPLDFIVFTSYYLLLTLKRETLR